MGIFSFLRKLVTKDSAFEIWFNEQSRKLRDGEEIEPPWIAYPETEGWWGGWRQGNSQGWLEFIWFPFWQNLSIDDRIDYAKRWSASSEWKEYLFDYWK